MKVFKGLKWIIPISLILWFFVYQVVEAEESLHMDFGLAYHDPKLDSFEQKDKTNISNLIGEVELSYEWENGTSIFIRHNSSVQQEDTGLNMIGIKARLF